MLSREIRLAARPTGEPQPSNFELAEVEVAEPAEGEIVVRNAFMSVDPYMRGRMDDRKSYVPPFVLDEPLSGGAVGEVVGSRRETSCCTSSAGASTQSWTRATRARSTRRWRRRPPTWACSACLA